MCRGQRSLWLCLVSLLLAACSLSNRPLHPQTATSSGELSALQAGYDVEHYRLELAIQPERRYIEGSVVMRALALEDLETIELDLDPRFAVTQVRVNDEPTSHRSEGGKLLLEEAQIGRGSKFTTRVSYHGRPYEAENPPWDGGFVWTQTEKGQHWIATAVQGRGCDLYWPCKDHISDKPERGADMLISVPSGLTAVMNGKLLSEVEEGDMTTFHWQTRNPISSYHLAVNVGPFQKYELQHSNALTGEGQIPIIFYHVTEDREKVEALIRDDFQKQLAFFERRLGPYPWGEEKIGIVEIPYLGMEHQTMNGYGNEFELDPYGFDWLMQHEFSHEWFGNLMTQKASRDFWLHEGFANYMQPVYAQEVIGDVGYWGYMWDFYKDIESCKPIVPAQQVNMDYFDSNDPYFKGSWILHTLRGLVGEEAFWRSLRRLIYDTAEPWELSYPIKPSSRSSEDFVRIVSDEYGSDLSWFFELYTGKGEVPKLLQQIEEGGLRLTWSDDLALPLRVPVEVNLDGRVSQHSVVADGSLFPIPQGARVQVDPQTSLYRDFGTTEGCQETID